VCGELGFVKSHPSQTARRMWHSQLFGWSGVGYPSNGWSNMELVECKERLEIKFSLYDATTYHNFPLDHVSLRASNIVG